MTSILKWNPLNYEKIQIGHDILNRKVPSSDQNFILSLYFRFRTKFQNDYRTLNILFSQTARKDWKDLQSKSEDILKKQKGRWDLKSGWRMMDRLRDCDSEWELLSQNGFLDLIVIIASFITISQLIKDGFQIILAN